MNNKKIIGLIVFVVVLILIIISAIVLIKNKKAKAPQPSPTAPAGMGSEIYEKVQPLSQGMPETNPFKSEVNPLKDAYKNPFEN